MPTVRHGDCGEHGMRAAAELRQHGDRMSAVDRFAEDLTVDDDDRVGADDHGIWIVQCESIGFGARQSLAIRHGRFVRTDGFVDVCWADFVRDPDERQQVASPRRLRGKDDTRARGRGNDWAVHVR